MIVVSLVLNLVVLVPVLGAMRSDRRWVTTAYGARTPARDILFAVYTAILMASAALLGGLALAAEREMIETAVVSLLAVQVVYKVGTTLTVRAALRNPVVLSNFAIAAVHGATITSLLVTS